MMTTKEKQKNLATALQLPREHKTLTLATCSGKLPSAASLYFVNDDELNLYFVSDPGSRHARELIVNSDVAITINADNVPWQDLRGLQIRGQVIPVLPEDQKAVLALYLNRFDDIAALFEAPCGSDERKIAERLASGIFFRIVPAWIRIIDNRLGFGFRTEWSI